MTDVARVKEVQTLVEADQWEADALASIQTVTTPEDAERLLKAVKSAEQAFKIHRLGEEREQRWSRLKLKAEHRYGVLLRENPPKMGPKAKSVTGGYTPPADRMAASRARKVAEVPAEKFESYIEDDPKPTRSGLLRLVKPKRKPKKPPLADWLLDMLPGAEPDGALRQTVVDWCRHGERIRDAMNGTGMKLAPKSDKDQEALLAALADVRKLAARLERQMTNDQSEEAEA